MLKAPDDKGLLLSCIDLRFPDRIIEAMDALGYRGKYYHLAMAGASHVAKHSSAWTTAFEDHLDFAWSTATSRDSSSSTIWIARRSISTKVLRQATPMANVRSTSTSRRW